MGIKLARNDGFEEVIFEVDSQVVVHFIHMRCCDNIFMKPLLQKILSMLDLPN